MNCPVKRVSWDEYFLGIAQAVANRADCTRRMVGAVIVDQEHRVISTGYNGAPPGKPGCLSDNACPRGRHTMKSCGCGQGSMCVCAPHCVCGCEWPCKYDVPPGSSYDTGAGACIAVHAEANALLYKRDSAVGCTLYITDEPCDGCKKLMAAAGIATAVYPQDGRVWKYHFDTGTVR